MGQGMLTQKEIERLLFKEKIILADKAIQKEAEDWDSPHWKVSPAIIATVYSFMKIRYESGMTIEDMERHLGICMEFISYALRDLEAYGYLTISRARKPFEYRVTK